MLGLGQILIINIILFVICAWVFAVERKRGQRLFLVNFRAGIDSLLDKLTKYIGNKLVYFTRHILKLSWYYGLHKFLRAILSGLVKTYDFFEAIFTANRDRAKKLKLEKKQLSEKNDSHLGQVAEHKAATALSAGEKKKLLKNKLERG